MAKGMARRKAFVEAMMRTVICEAAIAVRKKHGPNGMTMERVATTAGVAKGTLYNYFRSKAELLAFVDTKAIEMRHAVSGDNFEE